MKNKFVKYILSVAVASCMTGCFDLDHEEFYNIDADGFPKSEAELDASIVGVYNTLADSYIQSGMDNCGAILNMLPTDEMNTSWEHTWRHRIDSYGRQMIVQLRKMFISNIKEG